MLIDKVARKLQKYNHNFDEKNAKILTMENLKVPQILTYHAPNFDLPKNTKEMLISIHLWMKMMVPYGPYSHFVCMSHETKVQD
jgi:hypothetical protein